jgi:phosphopantetheine--protein transferase-like protein
MAAGELPPDAGALLRKAVANFFEVDESEVGPGFSLQGRRGQGSIARATLDSLIRRRVGLKARSVYSARTYGELEAELVPQAVPSTAVSVASPVPSPSVPSANGRDVAAPPDAAAGRVRCGIDIELIDHLPRAADCWEDPFYRDHFAPAEIAYCLLQEVPALHFAARWCAKEALKKCDASFLATAPNTIEVVADGTGAPFLVHHHGGGAHRLAHAVSLSHTPHAAVAVVVKLEPPVPAASTPREISPTLPVPSPVPLPRRRAGVLPNLLGLVALGVALAALVRTFWIVR